MPFTFCHAAAVIPIHRYGCTITSLPALVIGSFVPDLVYFIPLGVSDEFTHSWLGVLLYSIPVGLALLYIYYALLRQPFLEWLPQAVASRLEQKVDWFPRHLRALLIVITSLALGAATHISWDAFTHANTMVVNRFDVLRAPVSIGGQLIPTFKLLQHGSSLIGFLVIAGATFSWLSRTAPIVPAGPRMSRARRLLAFVAVLLAGSTGGAAGLLLLRAVSIEHALFNMTVTAIPAAALAVVLLCLGWRVFPSWRAER